MTTTAIATVEVDRLAKLLRLIFATDKSGEAAAGVAAVKRSLKSNGLDAHFVADNFARGATSIVLRTSDKDAERDERSDAWFAYHQRHRLSPKERRFVESIVECSGPLSDKQRNWLRDIVDRLGAR